MLQNATQVILTKALDGLALKHRAIANNVANVETPNYKRLDVSFQQELKSALDASPDQDNLDASDFEAMSPKLTKDSANPANGIGNNVDVDQEFTSMAENTLQYESVIRALVMENGMLKTAIYEGKK